MLNKLNSYQILSTEFYNHLNLFWPNKSTCPIIPANKSTLFGVADRDPNNYKRILRFNVLMPSKTISEVGGPLTRIDGSVAASFHTKVNEGLKDTYPLMDKFAEIFTNAYVKANSTSSCFKQIIFLESQTVDLGQETADSNFYNTAITIPFYTYLK